MKNEPNENNNNILDENKKFSHSQNQLTIVTVSGYHLVPTKLDQNFFENLLTLEMELEEEFSIQKLSELTKQYSIAIEYYLQVEPLKAKAFQNRMEYLLTNKDTLMKLKKQKDTKNNDKKDTNNNIKNIDKSLNISRGKSDMNMKKVKLKLRKDEINQEDLSQKIDDFLNINTSKSENKISVKNIINNDLEKQNLNWKEKLKKKKKNSSRQSFKPSIGGIKRRFYSINNDLSISPLSSEISEKTDDKKATSISEELYDKENSVEEFKDNDLNIIDEKNELKNEENKIDIIIEEKNEDEDKIIKENDANEINAENKNNDKNNEEGKKENLIQEKEKVEIKIELKEDKKDDGNEKEEEKKEDIKEEEIKKEIKQENIEKKEELVKDENKIEEIKHEDDSKEKNINEIKQDKNEINTKTEENTIESSNIETPKKNPEINSQSSLQEHYISAGRKSIIDEDLIAKINPDEEITSSIESQITSLQKIISNLNIKNTSQNEIDNEEDEESEFSNSNNNLIKIKSAHNNIDKIPAKFQGAYIDIELIIQQYMNDFNLFFYKEIFEQFSSELKELYEMKYKKYIEIRNEYHNQIKENEYLLEIDDNLTKEKKEEIQQTIESLNEEQQHQIDVVEDEFNKKISDKISEFKLNSFKHNSGIQLLEEKVKLDIYSLINEAFY